ncbi:3922_t:CDS:2, partial [Acaulospora morrowiae]
EEEATSSTAYHNSHQDLPRSNQMNNPEEKIWDVKRALELRHTNSLPCMQLISPAQRIAETSTTTDDLATHQLLTKYYDGYA